MLLATIESKAPDSLSSSMGRFRTRRPRLFRLNAQAVPQRPLRHVHPNPRRVQTTAGGWISRDTANKLQQQGHAQWIGGRIELFIGLGHPMNREIRRALGSRNPKHRARYDETLHHANAQNQHRSDLLNFLRYSPDLTL